MGKNYAGKVNLGVFNAMTAKQMAHLLRHLSLSDVTESQLRPGA